MLEVVVQQCCVRLHAALQACGVNLQLKCQKKWLRSHLSKVFLHETIEACTEASSQTDYFLFRDRRMCVEKKKTGGLFTASARFVVMVGVEVFFSRFAFVLHSMITRALPSKMKNVWEARLTFNLQIIVYYTRGGEWFFKNSGSRKILVEFHGSCSLVFWAVMWVSLLE